MNNPLKKDLRATALKEVKTRSGIAGLDIFKIAGNSKSGTKRSKKVRSSIEWIRHKACKAGNSSRKQIITSKRSRYMYDVRLYDCIDVMYLLPKGERHSAKGAKKVMTQTPSLAFDTEQEAIKGFYKQVTNEKVEGANFKLGLMYLDYAQDKQWDDLEDVAIKYVRRIEDSETAKVLGDPSGPSPTPSTTPSASSASSVTTYTADKLLDLLPGLIVNNTYHQYIPFALPGIIGGKSTGFVNDDLVPLAQQVRVASELFVRVQSIMDVGVLKPTDLARMQRNFTPSSDIGNQDKISLYDINMDRNKTEIEERFPYPGYQSIAPVLERRDDGASHVKRIYQAALAGRAKALQQFKEFRDMILKDFSKVFTDDEDATVAKLPAMMKKIQQQKVGGGMTVYSLFVSYIVRQPEVVPVFERRASRSAMFLFSKGTSLDGDRAKSGANIQELRISKSLEAKSITHVLLPQYMQGFTPALKKLRDDIVYIFVMNTAKVIQVGYYDFASGVRTTVQIVVPDYQFVIQQLIDKGTRSMLTHITNID